MSIRLRGSRFQVRVTVNGHTAAQSFDTLAEAQRWEAHQKILLEHGVAGRSKPVTPTAKISLADAIDRYSIEILPGKRGRRSEQYLLRYWRNSSLGKCQVRS
ncbi:MAG: hypothetical protein AAFV54_02355 [Pseudomonadota bacterium]